MRLKAIFAFISGKPPPIATRTPATLQVGQYHRHAFTYDPAHSKPRPSLPIVAVPSTSEVVWPR